MTRRRRFGHRGIVCDGGVSSNSLRLVWCISRSRVLLLFLVEEPLPSRGLVAEGLLLARTRRKKSTPPVVLIVEDEPDLRVLAESNIADIATRPFRQETAMRQRPY
jgi:hypothetical protein